MTLTTKIIKLLYKLLVFLIQGMATKVRVAPGRDSLLLVDICKGCESLGMEKIDYSLTLKPAKVTIRVRGTCRPYGGNNIRGKSFAP